MPPQSHLGSPTKRNGSSKGGSSNTEAMTGIEVELGAVATGFGKVMKLLSEERTRLAAERESFQREKSGFLSMQKRVEEVNQMGRRKIVLNIGGTIFETSSDTVMADPGSMLEAMFSGKFTIERDEQGACFIDRDPLHFPMILSYLRYKRENPPTSPLTTALQKLSCDPIASEELLKEANFYGLNELEKLIVSSSSLIVSQNGSSKYQRISDALKAAKDGDTILVKPGTYVEYLNIEKSVEIIGDSPDRTSVVLAYSGEHVVLCCAENPVLRNIMINQQGDEYHSLFITSGCVTVDSCTFASSGWACIGISGDNTHPYLINNKILSSADNGIIILSKGKGVIENNDIEGFTLQGIEIREGSNPVIRNNKIHHGEDSGIYINTKGKGVIEGNEIYSNAFNGIAVKFEVREGG